MNDGIAMMAHIELLVSTSCGAVFTSLGPQTSGSGPVLSTATVPRELGEKSRMAGTGGLVMSGCAFAFIAATAGTSATVPYTYYQASTDAASAVERHSDLADPCPADSPNIIAHLEGDRTGLRVAEEGSIRNAKAWLTDVSSQLHAERIQPAPHVTASHCGEVVFEWWSGRKKLTIYIGPESAEFVRAWGPDMDSEMDDGAVPAQDFARLLEWLKSEGSIS